MTAANWREYPYITIDPAVVAAWSARWATVHAPRWRKIGLGYFPRQAPAVVHAGARVLPESNQSVKAIRALQALIRTKETE